ncbi:uncharacterized protein LOC132271101 isoform X2 [Cornus florida]|uniref:uncharacterized protein LOC132271101 isoform X2 n=1 Tax=Cornus florida TaxID=4283 RepID=UPI00289E65B5|nr:uncharacterized protein LOC132271101 isoform X2 [Cornus florida]
MPQTVGSVSDQPSDSYNPTPMNIDGEQREEEGVCTEAIAQRDASPVSKNAEESEGQTKTGKKRDLSEYNLNGLKCPICMDLWTSQGDHQVCCLPCGHIFGMSCINRWILHRGGHSAKCPQCNAKINMKDVTRLYASPVIMVDEDLHKKIESLEAENTYLKTEKANLIGLQDSLLKELCHLKEKSALGASVVMGRNGFNTSEVLQKGQSGLNFGTNISRWGSFHCKFVLELEMAVDNARLFDMDAHNRTLIVARRISGMGGTHMLNKINLINPNENEDIELPSSMKAVKDLRVSPCSRLALLASLGKKLSVLSMGGNNVIISYDLPAPAWSCSWDLNSPHYMYAGLQNGKLLVFDMRQTILPVKSIDGLTSHPIHTIHSFEHDPALPHISTRLLTASSIGPCVWNNISARERFSIRAVWCQLLAKKSVSYVRLRFNSLTTTNYKRTEFNLIGHAISGPRIRESRQVYITCLQPLK